VPELAEIVLRSLLVSGTATLLAAFAGVPLGVTLGLSRFPLRSLLAAIVRTGMAMPPVVVGLLVYLLLSRGGPLGGLGLDWLFSVRAMIAAQTLLALPFVVGVTMNALESLPTGLDAQIRALGATEAQLRWTLVREAKSGILLALALAFGRSISEVGAVLIVGGNIPGHTRVLTTAIVLETTQGDFALALSLGCILLAIALAANYLLVRSLGWRAA
jgi:tungstate transport system permease protein